ncbi:hypothetical protein OV079_46310 [Nannocystis pusilla]|uniref:Uncharacterized protein n=1 Tax=Nannocystis pusilla TaxID=889268 RepID=A0A9X3F7B3_9BACT|nr:hypothetical protein [Nannocystis pusilla]MCY1012831.1 hypothetical protein [Nannocystis pusilla]
MPQNHVLAAIGADEVSRRPPDPAAQRALSGRAAGSGKDMSFRT